MRIFSSADLVAVLLTVAGLLSTAAATAALSTPAAVVAPSPTAADQEAGMTAGAPFRDPADAVEAWYGAELTITLNAADTRLDLSGRPVWGQSYNGAHIAPTIRFASGGRVAIRLVNHLSVATNLHFHGLHVSPALDADDDFLCVAPGGTVTYHLAIAAIAQHRDVVLSESTDGLTFYIDGRRFAMDRSIFTTPARLGTVEQWTLGNASGEDHPFHLHTSSFQVMSINGTAVPYTHRQDIVPVPHAVHGVPGTVVIRIPFNDHPGRWLFHCHIATHEDNGMMSFINVLP